VYSKSIYKMSKTTRTEGPYILGVVVKHCGVMGVRSECTALLKPEAWKVRKDSGIGFQLIALRLNYLLSCARVFHIAYQSSEVNPEWSIAL